MGIPLERQAAGYHDTTGFDKRGTLQWNTKFASFSSLTEEVNMQSSATQLAAEELVDYGPPTSNSSRNYGTLSRVEPGVPSPVDASRPKLPQFLSAPPSPTLLRSTGCFKRSKRKSSPTFAQSSISSTAFRSRTLSHSTSAPTLSGSSRSSLPPSSEAFPCPSMSFVLHSRSFSRAPV